MMVVFSLRDFDNLMQHKPRYEFREERLVPHGRVIRLEDWHYESETHVVYSYVLLWEDQQKKRLPLDDGHLQPQAPGAS